MSESVIRVRGAREHNLRDLDLELPRNRLIVITGLSGSGKSSLAFDTIYAEGQRRYVESLSAYARQFLGQMDKPDVDSIEGLSPAISIEQKGATRNPRSTVGTITEIYDYLRLLYARAGTPHCPQCGRPIVAQTIDQMTETVLALGEGTKVQILAPLVRGRKGEHEAVFRAARKDGFVRVRVDGEVHEVERVPRLDKKKKHDVEVVVDRIVVKASARSRLADSLTTASRVGQGTVVLEVAGGDGDLVLSESFACPDCSVSLGELTPRSFSFNSPYGACPACNGLGSRMSVDPELVVPDEHLSVKGGAIAPWRDAKSGWYRTMLKSVAEHGGFDLETPWNELDAKTRKLILWGTKEELEFRWEGKRTTGTYKAPFDGVIPSLERRHKQTESEGSRQQIERFMRRVKCADCEGTRLRPESRAVRVGDLGISQLAEMQIDEARSFLTRLKLDARRRQIAGPVLKEIRERLDFLTNVGVGYLSLDRAGNSLSGGEAQRIRLATQLGSSLVGVLYILDEPSIGLHARDHRRLLDSLERLRDLGNTVLVVEHDRDTMLAADHLLDLGPGAGRHGGTIVAAGTPKQVMRSAASLTGKYLSGRRTIETPEQRRPSTGVLTVVGACEHNLRDLDVEFPLGNFVCVTGVSGSGKSTLVNQILARAAAATLHGARTAPGRHRKIRGLDALDKAIVIDQSPIGRTPRSNPATYTGVFTDIRSLFAETKDAKVRGYKPGRFSFNVRGGRCEACEGDGLVRIEMHFLPDVFVRCDECDGARYNRETLAIKYKGASIAEVLEMTVDEGLEFLSNIPSIKRRLQVLSDVGLGYVHLGQSATTLSGGEAQRVKLATELARVATGRTLYILDEPTTGLHFEDIRNLLRVLQLLVDRGNTVVVIEHNLDVIKCADHVIDLGPEGGHGGGAIVARGTPEEIAAEAGSHTGAALREVLGGAGKGRKRAGKRSRPRRAAESGAGSGR